MSRITEPKIVALAFGAAAVVLLCIVALAETGDIWIGVLGLLAFIAVAVAIALELRRVIADSDEPEAAPAGLPPDRSIVLCSEALTAQQVLDAVGSGRSAIMVVAREGADYAQALRAEADTVAALRRAGVSASGHVGDHNPAHAIEDALALFPASDVVVVARGTEAVVYREHVDAEEIRRRTGAEVRVLG